MNCAKQANSVVFLDKNHPKDSVAKVIDEIEANIPRNVDSQFVYLVPEIDPRTSICRLPFSASFMLQAFARCQKRSSHFTLDNSDPVKLVEIQTMFMLLNKDIRFDEDFADSIGFDDYLRLPMSNEKIVIPDELLDTLTKVMLNFRGVGKSNSGLISSFIEMLKKYDALLSKQVDTKTIVNAFIE